MKIKDFQDLFKATIQPALEPEKDAVFCMFFSKEDNSFSAMGTNLDFGDTLIIFNTLIRRAKMNELEVEALFQHIKEEMKGNFKATNPENGKI